MPPERKIYLLNSQELDPETIAVTFARTSRSPQSFRTIAAELTAEKSAAFHEKWVVGYGHSSVAEHAVLHIAMENVSRLAIETIESNRLASYTEKSTRYQKWTADQFYIPPELADHPLLALYEKTCADLLAAYRETLPAVKADVERDFPQQEGESNHAWEQRIRSEYTDVCRFLLPSASLANLGMTINTRALEHALCKLLSHPLREVQQIGEEIKSAALASTPTLLKYANCNAYLVETSQDLEKCAAEVIPTPVADIGDWCRLVSVTPQAEEHVLAAALYRFSNLGYAQALQHVQNAPAAEREQLAHMLFGRLQVHDIPLRELEYASYLFDVIVDQGAYFELKRHRMMTQTAQPLTTRLGYAIPRRMQSAGVDEMYHRAMQEAEAAYETLADFNPQVAAYCVPNGFHRRTLLEFNLRTAHHFLALRSAPNAHFSMRRLAQRMAAEIRNATPLFAPYLCITNQETWQSIEDQFFGKRISS